MVIKTSGIFIITDPEAVGELFKVMAENEDKSPMNYISTIIKRYILQQRPSIIKKLNAKLEKDFKEIDEGIKELSKQRNEVEKSVKGFDDIPFEDWNFEEMEKEKDKLSNLERDLESLEARKSGLKDDYDNMLQILEEFEFLSL